METLTKGLQNLSKATMTSPLTAYDALLTDLFRAIDQLPQKRKSPAKAGRATELERFEIKRAVYDRVTDTTTPSDIYHRLSTFVQGDPLLSPLQITLDRYRKSSLNAKKGPSKSTKTTKS